MERVLVTTAERVRVVIDRLVRDGTAVARADASVHTLFPVAASAAEGEALTNWVIRESAARTIEVGLGYGISALSISEGLLTNGGAHARHWAVLGTSAAPDTRRFDDFVDF